MTLDIIAPYFGMVIGIILSWLLIKTPLFSLFLCFVFILGGLAFSFAAYVFAWPAIDIIGLSGSYCVLVPAALGFIVWDILVLWLFCANS